MSISFETYRQNSTSYGQTTRIHGATVTIVMEHLKLEQHTCRLFHRTLAAHRITWKEGKILTVGTLEQISKVFKHSGPGASFETAESSIGQFTEFLLGKRSSPPDDFLKKGTTLRAILLKADPTMLKEFRAELQRALLSAKHKNDLVKSTFINNILALIPFTYPEEGEQLTVPIKKDDHWVNVTYTLDKKISLTPSWFSSPIPAYGFVSDQGPPLLLFIGTTYPTGEGCSATRFADFTPGMSVGHAPSLLGKKKLATWLDDKNNVRVCGVSLGGSCALHAARLHTKKISEVYAFNPAGLYPWDWLGFEQGDMDIKIFGQWNDLVSTMGVFPKKAKIYRVMGAQKENPLYSHVRVNSGSKNVAFAETSTDYEHSRFSRQFLTSLHLLFSSVLCLLMLPFHLIKRFFELIYQALRSCFPERQSPQILRV